MDEKEILMEEYKICVESKHHHERVMWTLLSIHLGITGVLLNFWINSQSSTSKGYEYLIMMVPLFSGIFTFLALIKHRIYWNLDIERAKEIEEKLGIKRYRYFEELYYKIKGKKIDKQSIGKNKSTIGRIDFSGWRGISAWEISLILILFTIIGSEYIIFISLSILHKNFWGISYSWWFIIASFSFIILYPIYAKILVPKISKTFDKILDKFSKIFK